MPKKKTVAKKTKPAAFNLFESDIVGHTQEAISALRSKKRKEPLTLKSLADIMSYILEIDEFALQAIFGSRGLRGRTIFEIIAGEGIGKTTLTFQLFGALMRSNNSPCLFINTEGENKLPSIERIKRALDPNPEVAEKMLQAVSIQDAFELRGAAEIFEEWVTTTREFLDENGGQDVPMVVAIDTLSKIMSPNEAASIIPSDSKTATKAKNLGEGSNLEFSKLIHEWCRRLFYMMQKYNVLLIPVSHQNTKIDMSGFGSPMSADVSAGYNKTKRGGKAVDQNSAMQITLKRTGFHKSSQNEVLGHKIQMRVVKSSVGADNKILDYFLKTTYTEDEPPDNLEQPLDFSEGLANMFVERKLLGTTVSRKRYTSDELGVDGVTSRAFSKEFKSRPDLVNKVGVILGIEGYLPEDWSDKTLASTDEV